VAIILCDQSAPELSVISVFDLFRNLSIYSDRLVAVRGVYYYTLEQKCPASCVTGPRPSHLWVVGTGRERWDALKEAERLAELEAGKGTRVEVWVTATGWLRTMARHSPLGPCDTVGSNYFGYGHLGGYPAELQVLRFSDIQIKPNSLSPYDYSKKSHRPFL
jgi:hypothetical protein